MRRNSIQEGLSEPWFIAPLGDNYIINAELRSTAGVNMTFATEDHMLIGDQFIACPADFAANTPDIMRGQIESHPEKITGEVIREDGEQVYKVRLCKDGRSSSPSDSSKKTHQFHEAGFRLTVEAHGRMNMKEFIQLITQIKARAVSALRILLDFSHVDDIPPTAPALMRDLIKHFARNNRLTALVGCEEHCSKMASQLPLSPHIKLFTRRDEADELFEQDPIRILVVEDDQTTQAFIMAFLEEQGLKPTCVSNAEDGIESAKQEKPDLILMDIHLPGMSGLDAIQQIRNNPNLSKTAIIILTGDASEGSVLAGKNAGINGYFLKPFHPKKFTQTIFEALEDVFEDEK